MLKAAAEFRAGVAAARESGVLFDYLTTHVGPPMSFEDLLRFQIVYAVSAFDKLIHDLIRIGMRDCFIAARAPTAKYKAETIGLGFHELLAAKIEAEAIAAVLNQPPPLPPKQFLFEQEVQRKLSLMTFQDPDRVTDGLSLIWDEKYKWDKIAGQMGLPSQRVRIQLRLIVTRRNAIVHEADVDPVLATKNPITRQIAMGSTDFIEQCGSAIAHLVL
jgi:hypothetical protein